MIKTLDESSFNNYFALFGELEIYSLDPVKLDTKRKELLIRLHPDRFCDGSAAQKRSSLQWTTRINQAYDVLKDPVKRAVYLCGLKGNTIDIEKSKAFSVEVLEQQMELREKLSEAVELFAECGFDATKLDDLEFQASSMLSNSVFNMTKLFSDNFSKNKEILNKIESQINISLFAQKFIVDCSEVRRKFL